MFLGNDMVWWTGIVGGVFFLLLIITALIKQCNYPYFYTGADRAAVTNLVIRNAGIATSGVYRTRAIHHEKPRYHSNRPPLLSNL